MKRYWRHYPKFLQVVLLMLMVFTLYSFASVLLFATLWPLFKVNFEALTKVDMGAPDRLIHAAQYMQAVISIFTFALSALLFAYLAHPRPSAYLGMRKPASGKMFALGLLCFISFIPLVNELETLLHNFDFGAAARFSYEKNKELTHAMMRGTSIPDLVLHLALFALLPAVGEELLFRGVIMRFAYRGNIHYAVFFSAAVFGLAHNSLYTFFPIMLMGVLLGYLYYFGGSLWLNICAHFTNNALAVVGLYLANTGVVNTETAEAEHFPWYVLAICAGVFVLLLPRLFRSPVKLPHDWNNDFKEEIPA